MTPTFQETTKVFARIGLLSFGGPAGQIALMHRLVVEENRWIGEEKFLRALNFCMLLPGPEAHQLAVYLGWMLHGIRGGIMAGALFLGPGVLVVLGLSALYLTTHQLPAVAAALLGLKAAVLVIVIEAVLKIGKRALVHASRVAIAAAAFVAIFFLNIPFPLIIAGAAALGAAGSYFGWHSFVATGEASAHKENGKLSFRLFFKTLAIGLGVWFLPLALLGIIAPPVFADLALLFSQLAVVTFGGAYAVLAYLAQESVAHFGWLEPGEMIDGLGLAETTPGPLILVVDFVGYLAGARFGGLSPVAGGVLGTLVALWATFIPSFLWIFLGAPYLERIRPGGLWDAALSGVTAAVLGVVLNLAVWFGLHVLFLETGTFEAGPVQVITPVLDSLSWQALILFGLSLALVFGLRRGVMTVLGISVLASLALNIF